VSSQTAQRATPASQMIDTAPTVTAIVPCRNEEAHIEACVRSILRQQPPPGGLEIIVADGMSEDGTRQILKGLFLEDPRLTIVDNPGRTAPCARNVGVRHARGRYVAILDAHTEYAHDYIVNCVALLEEHPEVCCTGGPIVSEGRSALGKGVAAAMSHPLGVGNAKHRFPDYEGYAEGACFPMFRREIFEQVGLFDEQLIRNQDDDFNYRVAKVGGKVYLSPKARCIYYVRESLSDLFWQYCQYGYWRVVVLRKHRLPSAWRQLVPVTFVLSTLLSLAVGTQLPSPWWLVSLLLPALYVLVLTIGACAVASRKGVSTGLFFPVCAAVMHFAYSFGFLWGLASVGTSIPSRRMGSLTRGRQREPAVHPKP
jgi:GT2 family glycosyltransferase